MIVCERLGGNVPVERRVKVVPVRDHTGDEIVAETIFVPFRPEFVRHGGHRLVEKPQARIEVTFRFTIDELA